MAIRGPMIISIFIFVLQLGICSASVALADDNGKLYTWTDESGVVHMADSLDKVPAKYQSKAKRIGEGSAESAAGGGKEPSTKAQAPTGSDEAQQKAYWQERMLDAKRRLQLAEETYRQLEARRTELSGKWGASAAALPPQNVLDEMKRLDAEAAAARTKLDEARNVFNVVLPDEARKAGVPPGWLREVQ